MNSSAHPPPDIGGIVHLDHVNFTVPAHDPVTGFFIHGLGLTRDPYQRTGEENIGINVGLQQFHLPRRGVTAPLPGVIGLVVPELSEIQTRLSDLETAGQFAGTAYEAQFDGASAEITSPFGFRLRLHTADSTPSLRTLGIAYVELDVVPGTADAIAAFYREVCHAIAEVETESDGKSARITAGPHQTIRFIERERDSYDTHNFHVSYYATHFNEVRDRMADAGIILGEARDIVFFFRGMFDPANGERVCPLINEVRSIYHPDFMRPLVNRWPNVDQPVFV